MSLVSRVGAVFSRAFGVSSDSFSPETVPESVPNWDSVGHMNLVTGLEAEFALQFEVDEIMEMSSGRRIIEILQARGIGE